MPSVSRRQAIGDESIRSGGLTRRSLSKIETGTHAHATYGGTISFRHGVFVGTPVVVMSPIGVGYRMSGGGTYVPLSVTARFPGSFMYFGSPKHGTFNWAAFGSISPPVT